MDENGIQLMTIHRSKGLEFKTVYVLGTVDGSIPHDFSLETARKVMKLLWRKKDACYM